MTSTATFAWDGRSLIGPSVPAVAAMLLLSTPVLAAGQPERAIVELVLNEVPRGEVLVVLDIGEIWIPVDALVSAGLTTLAGRRTRFDEREFVSAASLEPAVTTVFDERALAIRLSAAPALFPTRSLTVERGRPQGIEYTRTPSAFINYAAAWHPAAGTDLFAEGAVSLGPAVLEAQATRLAAVGGVVLGMTRLVVDERRAMRRWTVGDLVAPGSVLRSGIVAGGVSVSREYSLDPYYEPFPSPAFSAMVTTPSTIEVYVNGQLVRRDALAPGPFEIRQMPLTTGMGNTRITIRDAYGQVREMGSPYYLASGLLKRGSHEYRYTFGARRSSDTTRPAEYGPVAVLGRSRVGLTDWFTLGVELEADRLAANAGPLANARLWRLGELEWASAVSRYAGRTGRAESLAYTFITRTFSVSAAVRLRSATYATLTTPPAGRVTSEVAASVSLPLGPRNSLSAQHVAADVADGARDAMVRRTGTSLSVTWRVGSRADLHTTVLWSNQAGPERRLTASTGLTLLFSSRTAAGVSHEVAGGRPPQTAIDLQRSNEAGPGFGYSIRGETSDASLGHARFEYQSTLGRYELIRDVGPGSPGTAVSASGAVVAVGRRLHLARTITSSYALVQVPGAQGVRVYANNQEIGRTDRRGDFIVPDLVPHYGNSLRIADEDVPFDRAVERVARTVAPPFRGAALARFDSPRIRAAWGTVVLVGENGLSTVPSYGEMAVRINGQRRVSPVGADGEFYFEGLAPSSHAAVIEHEGSSYICSFQIPESAGPLVDLGTVACGPGMIGDTR